MINALKGILAFLAAQIIVSVSFFLISTSAIARALISLLFYGETNGVMFICCLAVQPIYAAHGYAAAEMLKLKKNISLIFVFIFGTAFLAAAYLYFRGDTGFDHSALMLYALINSPGGLALMSSYDLANYLFVILPPGLFTLGILLRTGRKR